MSPSTEKKKRMPSPIAIVRKQQHEWANRRGIAIDSSDYTESLQQNLFKPLSAGARADFEQGDGRELGEPGVRGKMQALRSSSALGCNVFDYWRERDATPIIRALGFSETVTGIDFERKFPTGLRGNAPNLDVVLACASGRLIAIECKFLEPYESHSSGFKPKYFESNPGLWEKLGFRECQALAERIQSGQENYRWLNPEQLLKHILGLSTTIRGDWSLLYLWYEAPGAAAAEHAAEADKFAAIASKDGIHFKSISYQELYRALASNPLEQHREYLTYLGERYFR